MHSMMKNVGKHVAALVLFLGLVMAYFSPAVFDGKVIRQGDNVKAAGMEEVRSINMQRLLNRVSLVYGRMLCFRGCLMDRDMEVRLRNCPLMASLTDG